MGWFKAAAAKERQDAPTKEFHAIDPTPAGTGVEFSPPQLDDSTLAAASQVLDPLVPGSKVTPSNVHNFIENKLVVQTTASYRAACVKQFVTEDPSAAAVAGRITRIMSEEGQGLKVEVLWSFGPTQKPQPMAGYRVGIDSKFFDLEMGVYIPPASGPAAGSAGGASGPETVNKKKGLFNRMGVRNPFKKRGKKAPANGADTEPETVASQEDDDEDVRDGEHSAESDPNAQDETAPGIGSA